MFTKRIFQWISVLSLLFICACKDVKQHSGGKIFHSDEELIHYFTKSGFFLKRINGRDYNLGALNTENIYTIHNAIARMSASKELSKGTLFYTKIAASVVDNKLIQTELIETYLLGQENEQGKTLLAISNLAKYQPEIPEFSESLDNITAFLNQEESYSFLTAINFIGHESLDIPEYDISQIKHLSNNSLKNLANNLSTGNLTQELRRIKKVLNTYIKRRNE